MRILVVRRDNIGDLVCTTPLLAALRRRHPNAWLGALVNSYNAAVLEGNKDIDELVTYTKLKHLEHGESAARALGRRFGSLWRLRRRELDLVVLATSDFSPRLLGLARLLSPQRIAGFSDGSRAARRLDLAVPIERLRGLHEVERVFSLAPLLGLEGPIPPLKVVPDSAEAAKARAAFTGSGPKVAVHVSARRPAQRWPAAKFTELIQLLGSRFGARPTLLWSPGSETNPQHPGDDEKARHIIDALPSEAVTPYPTRSLKELIGALAAADAVICSDGGASHLAAALGKPVVCFFGDSPAERWRPWGVPSRVLQPPSRQVSDITVREATDALAGLRS